MSNCSKSVHNHVHIKTVCVFPHDSIPDGLVHTPPRFYTEVLGPLYDIIERRRKQLLGVDSAAVEIYSSQEAKRQWWKDRQDIDFELSCLVEKNEAEYFRASSVNMVVDQGQGSQNNQDDSSLSNNGIIINLAERFEAACTIADITKESIVNGEFNTVANLEKLTVLKLKTELDKYGFEKKKMNRMWKAALIYLLQSEIQKEEKRQY